MTAAHLSIFPIRIPFAAALIAAWLLAFGCSSVPEKTPLPSAEGAEGAESAPAAEASEGVPSAEGAERTDAQIFVGDKIEMNYDPNVIMKRAESFHEKEGYAEAIVEYGHFLELHSQHILAPYAQYRLALSHFKMADRIDRDSTPVKKAREEFVKLVTEFPDSRYEEEALASIHQCDRHLAQHHLFVGKFYYRKEAYLAAARRFRNIVERYPDIDEAAESKLYLTKTYKDLGALEWSRDWALALVRQHPQHESRDEGLQLLTTLLQEHPNLATAKSAHSDAPAIDLDFDTGPVSAQPAGAATLRAAVFPVSLPATQCRIGDWCESGAATRPPVPDPRSVAQVITCRPGAWCE